MDKKVKIIMSCLIVIIIVMISVIIYGGITNKKTEEDNNNVNSNVNNNLTDADTNKELFCEKEFEFDSKEFKYTLTKEQVSIDLM